MAFRVYCDMDGVVADFATPAGEFFGVDFSRGYVTIDHREWKRLQEEWPTFWLDLDPLPHGIELWRALQEHHASILTAIPQVWPSAATGKQVWCKRWLPKFGYHPKQSFHAVQREEKQKFAFANGHPNILIDDLDRNVHEWERAGGIGIHYQPSRTSVSAVVRAIEKVSK